MREPISLCGPRAVSVQQVLVVETATGAGVSDDPIRGVTQYWSMGGTLLAVRDHYLQPELDPDEYWRKVGA